MRARAKKQTALRFEFESPAAGGPIQFAIHAPFIEQHFRHGDGGLGLTVAIVPDVDLQEDQRSAFHAACLWAPLDHPIFGPLVADACDDELLDSVDASADMLLLLCRGSGAPANFVPEALLLIRNARDPQSEPEEIARF